MGGEACEGAVGLRGRIDPSVGVPHLGSSTNVDFPLGLVRTRDDFSEVIFRTFSFFSISFSVLSDYTHPTSLGP